MAEAGIRQWIRFCGRRLAKAEVPRLDSPTGPRGRIGEDFYRRADAVHWRVRYLKTLQEVFHVWVDEAGTLRTDHTVRFLGMTVLRLHYKLTQMRG